MTLHVNETAYRARQRATATHPAFALMTAQAAVLGWPRAFASDLYKHDRNALEGQPSARRFVWAIGESCTVLVWLDPAIGQRERASRWGHGKALAYVDTVEECAPRMFVWDGACLAPIDRARMVSLLEGQTGNE